MSATDTRNDPSLDSNATDEPPKFFGKYRATVINAFQNVADALQAVQADAEAERATRHSLDLADRTLAIARRQLELGDISALAVIQAEQARQQALVAHVQARAQRLQDAAALLQSLGGGWWNREHAEAARD